jgi:hypothetical protein
MDVRRTEKIHTRSYFQINGHLVPSDILNEEQKNYAGVKLRETYLNGIFRGHAVFTPEIDLPQPEKVFPEYYR